MELQWSVGLVYEPWERLAEALRPEWIFYTSQLSMTPESTTAERMVTSAALPRSWLMILQWKSIAQRLLLHRSGDFAAVTDLLVVLANASVITIAHTCMY